MTVVLNNAFLPLYQISIFQVRKPKSRGKVTHSRLWDWDQTQDSEPGLEPRNVQLQKLAPTFCFSSFFSREEGPVTGILFTKWAKAPGFWWRERTGLAQVNCAFVGQAALARDSRGCEGATESGAGGSWDDRRWMCWKVVLRSLLQRGTIFWGTIGWFHITVFTRISGRAELSWFFTRHTLVPHLSKAPLAQEQKMEMHLLLPQARAWGDYLANSLVTFGHLRHFSYPAAPLPKWTQRHFSKCSAQTSMWQNSLSVCLSFLPKWNHDVKIQSFIHLETMW